MRDVPNCPLNKLAIREGAAGAVGKNGFRGGSGHARSCAGIKAAPHILKLKRSAPRYAGFSGDTHGKPGRIGAVNPEGSRCAGCCVAEAGGAAGTFFEKKCEKVKKGIVPPAR